jgi:glyoxylase-like metal-dependent hydrolase (beta-lactamase superfamily II)
MSNFIHKANVVFCDDHVESPTLQFLFADTSDAALARWNRSLRTAKSSAAPRKIAVAAFGRKPPPEKFP